MADRKLIMQDGNDFERMTTKELKDFLMKRCCNTIQPNFIENDPIQIPHRFTQKEDIEIAGFLMATIVGETEKASSTTPHGSCNWWTMPLMILWCTIPKQTWKPVQLLYTVLSMVKTSSILLKRSRTFTIAMKIWNLFLPNMRPLHHCNWPFMNSKQFLNCPIPPHPKKHISDPMKQSAAKRINMFLRWMVQRYCGWTLAYGNPCAPAQLSCPLDVHTGNVGRKLNLLRRKQNDAKAFKGTWCFPTQDGSKRPCEIRFLLHYLALGSWRFWIANI